MPKIPPKLREDVPVPRDLARVRRGKPHRAHETKLGTLWLADCMDFLAALPAGSARLVFADPPYAIAKESWDEFESEEAYVAWCDGWLAEVHRVLAADGTAYVCGFSEILASIKVRSAGRFAACRWLVWSYRNKANLGSDWGRSHESLLHLRKSKRFVMNVDEARVPYNDHTRRYPDRVQAVSSQYGGEGARRDRWTPHPLGAKPRDVLDIPVICNGMSEKTAHPTQKPEELLRRIIGASSNPGDLVVDPFCGSGTTLVVAERLGRRWLGADADPRYIGLARTRL